MQGFLTFGGSEDGVHLVQLPLHRFTFGSNDKMDLAVTVPGLPGYCGSFNWDHERGSWALETDAAARGMMKLNGMPLNQPSMLLEDGAIISAGAFTLRFDLLPQVPVVGGVESRVIPLVGKQIRMGRGNEEGDATKIVLDTDDGDVSRAHATLEWEETEKSWYLRDHSEAGTELNGQTFDRARLVIGDRFRIGHYVFEFTGRSLRRLPTSSAGRIVGRGLTRIVHVAGEERRILNEVSMDVPPGAFVGLLGGSGQGKSTLMTALCGLNPPTSGEVLLNGVKIGPGSGGNQGRIGFVPQDDIVHTDLTVLEAITYSARLRLPDNPPQSEIDALVMATVRTLSLEPHIHKRVYKLSGGQRKRVSIATEMLMKPSVLFLDEPSSGLDPATEFYLMETLRLLAGADCTVLCTTHVLGFAHLFDRITFVQSGRVVFYGRPDYATKFFERDDWVDVYLLLDNSGKGKGKPPETWEAEYLASTYKPEPEPAIPLVHDQGLAPPAPRPGTWKTLRTLLERQWAILMADKLNIGFLMAQALAIAVLIGWVATADGLRSFLSVVAVLWFGCSNAAQQIVSELAIFRRERVCGLGLNVYLQSKIFFTLALTAVQAVLLFITVTTTAHFVHHGTFDDKQLREDARLGGGDTDEEIKIEESPGKGLKELGRLFGFNEADAEKITRQFITGDVIDRETGKAVLDENNQPIKALDEKAIVYGAWHLAKGMQLEGLSLNSREARDRVNAELTPALNAPGPVEVKPSKPGAFTVSVMLSLIEWFELQENVLDSAAKPYNGGQKDLITNKVKYTLALPLSTVVLLPVALKMLALVAAACMGVCMGLTISALVRSPTQAVMWVPLILIPQILFGGYVVTRPEMGGVLRSISAAIPSAAAQRITEVAALHGQAVPAITNRTRIPSFIESSNKETVTWIDEKGEEQEEDKYERASASNVAFQNLVVNPAKAGKRMIEEDDEGQLPALVKSRDDVLPFRQGTVYDDLSPVWRSLGILLAWVVGCYAAAWHGLRQKQPL